MPLQLNIQRRRTEREPRAARSRQRSADSAQARRRVPAPFAWHFYSAAIPRSRIRSCSTRSTGLRALGCEIATASINLARPHLRLDSLPAERTESRRATRSTSSNRQAGGAIASILADARSPGPTSSSRAGFFLQCCACAASPCAHACVLARSTLRKHSSLAAGCGTKIMQPSACAFWRSGRIGRHAHFHRVEYSLLAHHSRA